VVTVAALLDYLGINGTFNLTDLKLQFEVVFLGVTLRRRLSN
jgi:hypothetical protein